jgi:hypothetical protein
MDLAEILALLKVAFLEGDSQHYLFKQSLINAQRKKQYHRLIFNLQGVVGGLQAWGSVTGLQHKLTQTLPNQHSLDHISP